MSILMPIILVLAGLYFLYYGATYLSASVETNSAIHEIAGGVGIGFALLMFGMALLFWRQASLHGRLIKKFRDLTEKVEVLISSRQVAAAPAVARIEPSPAATRATADRLVDMVDDKMRNQLVVLKTLATASGSIHAQHVSQMVDFTQRRMGWVSLTAEELNAVRAYVERMVIDDAAIQSALAALPTLDATAKGPLRQASSEIVKSFGGQGEKQASLLAHIQRLLA